MIKIVETDNHKLFVSIPSKIYRGDFFYVQQLIEEELKLIDTKNNPFYKNALIKLFIAYKDNKIAGRIAAIINKRHNLIHKDNVGFFGFFESINDLDVAKQLFESAECFLKSNGMDYIRGPMNPSMNDTCGILIQGFFQEPVFMMPYNRKYYAELIEKCGFQKDKDLYAFYIATLNKPKGSLEKLANYVQKKHSITLRNFSRKHFDRDIEIIHNLYSKAWKDNWGFVAPTLEEFRYGTEDFKKLVPEELVIIAEKDNKACGFSAIVPDFNQALKRLDGKITPMNALKALYLIKKINNYRLITLGVLPEYRKMGIDLLLYIKSFEAVEKRKGKGGEASWTLEDNISINKPILKMNAEKYKAYRIYGKPI
jgi:GNAT superfamily N-acetyltransferase